MINDYSDAADEDADAVDADDDAVDVDNDAVDVDDDAVDVDDAIDVDDDDFDADDGLTQQHLPHLLRPQRPRLLVQGLLLLPAEAIAPGEPPSESQVLYFSSIRPRA